MICSLVWPIRVTTLLCLHLCSSFTNAQSNTTVFFDYTNGPGGAAKWGNFPGWSTCKTGETQSPMAIAPEMMVTNKHLDLHLKSEYPERLVPASITNDGHTVDLFVSGLELIINGSRYLSEQFHFHYPSEHTIMGHKFAMELHLVHVEPVTGQTAVVAWLFTLGQDDPFLDQFFDKLPAYRTNTITPIEPIKMLKSNKGTYGRYVGSLTTPPCTEDTVWTIMLWDFPTISTKQLDFFRKAIPHPNARPTQPANGRKLEISTRND